MNPLRSLHAALFKRFGPPPTPPGTVYVGELPWACWGHDTYILYLGKWRRVAQVRPAVTGSVSPMRPNVIDDDTVGEVNLEDNITFLTRDRRWPTRITVEFPTAISGWGD